MNRQTQTEKQKQTLHKERPSPSPNLRRMDWRFLLPQPPDGKFRHLLLLGGSPTLAARLVAAHLAAKVTSEIQEGCQADAVVVLHKSAITIEQAAACLEPGGVFYQEIARTALLSLRTTPEQLRRRLEKYGLTLTGLYWAAPNFEQCRRYIPLDLPSAVQWYFSSLFVAGTPIHWLIRAFFRLVAGWGRYGLGSIVPYISITAMHKADVTPLPSLLGDSRVTNALPNATLHPMLVTSGQDDASRLIMLPFAQQQSQQPQAVIKIATDPKFNRETEVEQSVLQEVRAQLDQGMRQTLPAPLATFRYHDLAVSVESCAPGKTIWASSGGWGVSAQNKIADLQHSARWITEFHRQTESARPTWDQRAIEEWIEMPFAAYAQLAAPSEAETRLFAYARAHAHRLLGAEFPLVWQHNDFAPWNIYRAGSQLTVIDWEFNRNWETTRAGPTLCDLLYFVTYWNNVARHLYTEQAEEDGMRQLFVDVAVGNRYVQAARQSIADYMVALNVDWGFLPLLLVYTWTERTVYSYTRTQKLQATTGTSRAADKFAKFITLLANHADDLFSEDHPGFWQSMRVRQPRSSTKPSTAEALG